MDLRWWKCWSSLRLSLCWLRLRSRYFHQSLKKPEKRRTLQMCAPLMHRYPQRHCSGIRRPPWPLTWSRSGPTGNRSIRWISAVSSITKSKETQIIGKVLLRRMEPVLFHIMKITELFWLGAGKPTLLPPSIRLTQAWRIFSHFYIVQTFGKTAL